MLTILWHMKGPITTDSEMGALVNDGFCCPDLKQNSDYDLNNACVLYISWRPLSRATRRIPFQWLLHRGLGEDATPFPGLLHFTHDTYLILLSVKQGGIKYHFKVFGMMQPGIELKSPRPLTNTQPTWPMSLFIYIYIYIYIYNVCDFFISQSSLPLFFLPFYSS